jgi:hypothetical protein
MQAVNQFQQTVSLLHELATGRGYAFQCMFLACPQYFLSCRIKLYFSPMKRVSSRVPTTNTPEIASLGKHHGAYTWTISTDGPNQRMKQHDGSPSALALLLLGLLAGVIARLRLLNFHHVPGTEVIKSFLTTLS